RFVALDLGGMALSPKGETLYVVQKDPGAILMLDPVTLAAIGPAIPAKGAFDIRMQPNADTGFILASTASAAGQIVIFDTATATLRTLALFDEPPHSLSFSVDGSRAIVARGSYDCSTAAGGALVIDTLGEQIVATLDPERPISAAAILPIADTAILADA